MDLQTARQRVQDYIIDLSAETQALIDAWINEAVNAAENRYNFRYMEQTLARETVAGVRKLDDKPALWKEAGSSPWLEYGDSAAREIEWGPSESEMLRQFSALDDEGQPRFLLETDTELHVYPLPDGQSDWPDDEYRVRVPYWSYSATLSNNADTNSLLSQAPWYVIFYAVAEGLVFNRDEQRAGVYQGKAEAQFVRARSQDKRSRLPDRMTLVPRRGTFGSAAAGRPRYRRL